MGKLIKAILVLAVVVAGVLLFLQYSNNSKSKPNATNTAQTEKKPKEGIQVQEKYGFAPVDPGN